MRYREGMHSVPQRSRRSKERLPFEVAWVELDTAPGHLGLAMAPGRREFAWTPAPEPAAGATDPSGVAVEPVGEPSGGAEVPATAAGVLVGGADVAPQGVADDPGAHEQARERVQAREREQARWQRDLHGDLRRLRHVHQCDVLVSLLDDEELSDLGIDDLEDAVAVHGFVHHRLPVRDGTVPDPEQLPEVLALIDVLREQLLAGRTLVLHCRAGQGRAGMLAALLVASLWELPGDAIERVRRAQPRAVETVPQEHYVYDTAFAWFKHHVERLPST